MKYKQIIYKKNKEGDLLIIVNDDSTPFKTNLGDNEIIIRQLSSENCPINRSCIDYIETDRFSRLCKHFINLMQLTRQTFSQEALFCSKNKKYHGVSVLKPIKCPSAKDSCLVCGDLANVKAVPYPEK